jgi:hypothetical protein
LKPEDTVIPASPEVVASAISKIKSLLYNPCHGYITDRVGLS